MIKNFSGKKTEGKISLKKIDQKFFEKNQQKKIGKKFPAKNQRKMLQTVVLSTGFWLYILPYLLKISRFNIITLVNQ